MYRIYALCVLCVCVCVRSHKHQVQQGDDSSPMRRSISGTFRGSWLETRRGRRLEAYRGIKYAEAPVEELRFQPPKPILTYQDVVNATEDGPRCPQPAAAELDVSEDCLFLNVYTPYISKDKRSQLPVIVFIHPGGFYSFSSRSNVFGPGYLLDKDIVLVTINYRLGSLGFLALGNELAPGNNGFKDQVVALKWVQRNIAAFGGNPNLVTIAGYSAGSKSVMLHMVSPMSRGLFHRAIALSAGAFAKVPDTSSLLDLAKKQAKISNCSEDDLKALYECLKTKSWREIQGSMLGFFEFGFDPLSLWRQVVEPDFGQERFLDMEPMDAIRQGKMNDVPCIIGQNTGEFFWKAFNYLCERLVSVLGDLYDRLPVSPGSGHLGSAVLNNQTLLDTMESEWDRIAPISFILPRNETHERLWQLRRAYFGDRGLTNDSDTAVALGHIYADSITAFPVHRSANLFCRHSKQPVYYYEFAYIGSHSFYEDPVTKKPIVAAHHDDLIYLFTLSFRFSTIDVADTEDSSMVDKMTKIWFNFAKFGDPNHSNNKFKPLPLHWPAMKPDQRNYLRIDKEFSVRQNLKEDRLNIWEELYPIQY